jgi:hypothetical protein
MLAIDLLRKNVNKISWQRLSTNPNAIDLLEDNKTKIDWDALSTNPSIFDEYLV